MARACDTVRGGIRCGRTAKMKVALIVWGERPATYSFYCQEHGDQWLARVQEILDDDVKADVSEL